MLFEESEGQIPSHMLRFVEHATLALAEHCLVVRGLQVIGT